jgi:hypothetical protein
MSGPVMIIGAGLSVLAVSAFAFAAYTTFEAALWWGDLTRPERWGAGLMSALGWLATALLSGLVWVLL